MILWRSSPFDDACCCRASANTTLIPPDPLCTFTALIFTAVAINNRAALWGGNKKNDCFWIQIIHRVLRSFFCFAPPPAALSNKRMKTDLAAHTFTFIYCAVHIARSLVKLFYLWILSCKVFGSVWGGRGIFFLQTFRDMEYIFNLLSGQIPLIQ